jgi:diguanylate cyclase (GGDEF)-like protein
MREDGRGKRRVVRDSAPVPAPPRAAAAAGRERRATPPLPADAPAKPSRRSQAMQLAAEVERLQQELASARARMAELEARADVDPLTEVLNRRGFDRELKRSLAYVKRYGASAALIYLDLDGFKSVNDRQGHAAGDAVLKAVALVLGRQVRASDVVARLGGDEFGLLLWNLSEADASEKALALEAAVSRTTAHHAGSAISVGASAGVAMIGPLDQAAQLLKRADRAMYARKAIRRTGMPVNGLP